MGNFRKNKKKRITQSDKDIAKIPRGSFHLAHRLHKVEYGIESDWLRLARISYIHYWMYRVNVAYRNLKISRKPKAMRTRRIETTEVKQRPTNIKEKKNPTRLINIFFFLTFFL